jgi:hypothetical protein
MIDASRTVNNPGTSETITFLETSEESGGIRSVGLAIHPVTLCHRRPRDIAR